MDGMQPTPRRLRKLLVSLAVIVIAGLSTYLSHQNPKPTLGQALQPGLYPVSEVVDGDTIVVNTGGHKETVRLIGMDTPETKDPRKPVQCYGENAHQKTQALIGSQSVRLEADPADSDRDKYHRLLRYVYLPDGTFVNMELVKQGYAFAYTVFPNSKLDQFRAAEADARQQNLGLWAGCNVDESQQIKQTAGSR